LTLEQIDEELSIDQVKWLYEDGYQRRLEQAAIQTEWTYDALVTSLVGVAGQIMAGLGGGQAPEIPAKLGILDWIERRETGEKASEKASEKPDLPAGNISPETGIKYYTPGAPDIADLLGTNTGRRRRKQKQENSGP